MGSLDKVEKPLHLRYCPMGNDDDWLTRSFLNDVDEFPSLKFPVFLDCTAVICDHYTSFAAGRVLYDLFSKIQNIWALDVAADTLSALWCFCFLDGKPCPLVTPTGSPRHLARFDDSYERSKSAWYLGADKLAGFINALHLENVEKLSLNPSILSSQFLTSNTKFSALKSLQIDAKTFQEDRVVEAIGLGPNPSRFREKANSV